MSAARRVRKWAVIVFASVGLVGIAGVVAVRLILANRLDIHGPDTVRESGYVTIGGVPQWIEIRGWDRKNPVLLWVHGGPGLPVLSAGYSSFLPWERHFTVVHWHQRGAGLSYAAASGPGRLTIDRMVRDGLEITEHLRRRLHVDTIILVGHSWGSLIGARMVQRRPDWFAAYVGTGQFTSLQDDGRDLYAAAMAKATRESNQTAMRALEAVAGLSVTDVRYMDVVRRWGRTEDVGDNPLMFYLGPLLSPGYPVWHVRSFRQGFEARVGLYQEQLRVNMFRDVPELRTPAFLFQGRDDWQVSTPSALRYFERLRAPRKEVVLFEGGHLVPMLQSEAFLRALRDKVRPLAVTGGD